MINSLIDAGPLIALFDKDDKHHNKVVKFLKNFNGHLFSTWPVITEVMHLLDFNVNVQSDFLEWITMKSVILLDLDHADIIRILELTKKYSDLPMDLADGSLLVLSERFQINNIITLDSDFYVYRLKNKKLLNNLFSKLL